MFQWLFRDFFYLLNLSRIGQENYIFVYKSEFLINIRDKHFFIGRDEKGCKMDVDGRRAYRRPHRKRQYSRRRPFCLIVPVDIDGLCRRLPFSRSTAGRPFHHALFIELIVYGHSSPQHFIKNINFMMLRLIVSIICRVL